MKPPHYNEGWLAIGLEKNEKLRGTSISKTKVKKSKFNIGIITSWDISRNNV